MPVESYRMAARLADTLLSVGHLAVARSFVSLHTHVQRIRQAGTHQTWPHQGNVSGYLAHLKM